MLFIRFHTIRIEDVFSLYETRETINRATTLSLQNMSSCFRWTTLMHRYVRYGNDRTSRLHVPARSVVSVNRRYPSQLVWRRCFFQGYSHWSHWETCRQSPDASRNYEVAATETLGILCSWRYLDETPGIGFRSPHSLGCRNPRYCCMACSRGGIGSELFGTHRSIVSRNTRLRKGFLLRWRSRIA